MPMGSAKVLNYEVFGKTIQDICTVQHEIYEIVLKNIDDCQVQLNETEQELMYSNELLQIALAVEAEKLALWQMALEELEAALASMDPEWIAQATVNEERARAEYYEAVRHREAMQRRVAMANECVQMSCDRLEETRSTYMHYHSKLDETIKVQFNRIMEADDKVKKYLSVNMPEALSTRTPDNKEPKNGFIGDGLTREQKDRIKKETGWSDEIIDHIQNWDQYEVYKNAGLKEGNINGRPCLLKNIDMDYFDEKTQMTNRQLMEKGRSPIDSKTGEKIELHHMGQGFESPFAELCENSEHGFNQKILHPKNEGSWRQDREKENQYQREKSAHWKKRAQEGVR